MTIQKPATARYIARVNFAGSSFAPPEFDFAPKSGLEVEPGDIVAIGTGTKDRKSTEWHKVTESGLARLANMAEAKSEWETNAAAICEANNA